MLDFLLSPFKSRKSKKIHNLLRQLLADLAPAPGDAPGNYPMRKSVSSISEGGCGSCSPEDEESVRERYADLEEFLASATSGKQFQNKPVRQEDVERCLSAALECELVLAISVRIGDVPSELRRVSSNVWNLLLKLQADGSKAKRFPLKEYVESKLQVVDELFARYTDISVYLHSPAVFVTVGVMLRDTFMLSQQVTEYSRKYILNHIFPIILNPQKLPISFDVTADAFSTLKELLLLHKSSGAFWLADNFQEFFANFRALVLPADPTPPSSSLHQSSDSLQMPPPAAAPALPSSSAGNEYVTVRQGASLLSSLVLDRAYVAVMLQIVQDTEMLKTVLMLLSNKSRVIELEAFHVLKVFIANPRKTGPIKKILAKNAARIVKLLERIEEARADDKEFLADKRVVVNKLADLEKEYLAAAAAAQLAVSNSEGEGPNPTKQ